MEERTVLLLIGLMCIMQCGISQRILERHEEECRKHINLEQCNWHYMSYFPRVFRTGVVENIMLSIHGYPRPVSINITLIDSFNQVFTSKTYRVQPDVLSTLPLYIEHNSPKSVKVKIEGTGEAIGDDRAWFFSNTSQYIHVQRLGLNILIQTDRPLYKPGQKIRSRVVVVDSALKPYEGMLDQITIENPAGSRMRQWNNVRLEEGFASFELQTSEKPVMGTWNIKVKLKSYIKKLAIQVKKYVLPTFQVTIKPPSFVSVLTKHFDLEFCAKYSYGKPVYGKLTAKICRHTNSWREKYPPSCFSISTKIDGCRTVTVKTNIFERIDKSYFSQKMMYTAEVKEIATGLSMGASEAQDIKRREVELTIVAKDIFKPGFPLNAKILAKYPDGRFIHATEVLVKAGSKGYYSSDLFNGTVPIADGWAQLKLPHIPFNAQSVHIRVSHIRPKLYPEEQLWKTQEIESMNIKPWYSPSHSYLHMEDYRAHTRDGSLPTYSVGKEEIEVGYTSVDSTEVEREIYYSLMCAGNIQASGTLKRTFIGAKPESGATTTTEGTTTEAPLTTLPETTSMTDDDYTTEPASTTEQISIPYWWNNKPVTRPPLPYLFSIGSFKIPVEIKSSMEPSCRLLVYYMRNQEVVAESMEFNVQAPRKHKIKMEFIQKVERPGSKSKLRIKGYPQSRFAVTVIDKSIHFLADGNDIKEKHLNDIQDGLTIGPGYVSDYNRCPYPWGKRKRRSFIHPGYSSNDFVDSEKAFASVGTYYMSSFQIDTRPCSTHPIAIPLVAESLGDMDGSKAGSQNARPRTEFPETWLWSEGRLSDNGTYVMDVTVPDSITTWYASGFGISKTAGLGIAKATELVAFQPFFISVNLPYSVIRGEDVTIPAAVFSYLNAGCISVRVSLAFSTDYRMIAGPSSKTCICEGRTATVLFRIRPKALGRIPIRISAQTLTENLCKPGYDFKDDVVAGDVLVKKLLVEAEGVKDEYTLSNFFCPKKSQGGIFHTDFDLKLPKNVVPGSVHTRISAIGDLMGPSLANIDELLAMPYGCGEQNMLKFAPNIFIMNYLNYTKQVTNEIEDKALNYMRTGYQKELTYKHKDGAYSAFGERDNEGSTWLTAFVLKSYSQARPWIEIDPSEIRQSMVWLKRNQDSHGCFPTIGELHNKAMKGGVKTPVTLTAYVLISLLEADLKINDPIAEKARMCVLHDLDNVTDTYSLAIISYMFAKLGDGENYGDTMARLDAMSIKKDGMIHWEEQKDDEEKPSNWYYKPRSTDIEQTAYVLLAKLEFDRKGGVGNVVPIVKWLTKQRNSLGGWSSTQDTVLAMQALSVFAKYTYGVDTDLSINVRCGPDFSHEFDINKKNNMVLQVVEDVPIPSLVKVSASGNGCALIQTSVLYNIKKVVNKPSFEVKYTITTVNAPRTSRQSCRSQNIQVCARWLREGESNMAIVNVQMISGFEPYPESLNLRSQYVKGLKDIEVKGKGVMYYFNRFDGNFRCFNLRVDQTSNVRNTKPVSITVYDYYDTEKSSTVMYGFSKEQCAGKARVEP